MIKLDNLKIIPPYTDEKLSIICAKTLNLPQKTIKKIKIFKKSIDARRKPNVYYMISAIVELEENLENNFKDLKYEEEDFSLQYEQKSINPSPVIIGFGPSGMFAGLALARMGLKPVILEQGKKVDEREKDVLEFWEKGKLNIFSNVQFGEGGAGTFSDGKLNSNVSNRHCKAVLQELVNFGAPPEILYDAKPHIGSDKLKNVVKSLREEILNLGGQIYFSHKMTDFDTHNGQIISVTVLDLNSGECKKIATNHLLLCVGHSGRDTFKLLYEKGVKLSQKPFAMGVRIEQKQSDINIAQYGKSAHLLPPADYKLVTHLPSGRSVFTFCMCPGGQVVASSSEEGRIVTNGMSEFARDRENANSALLVNVTPEDYHSSHPLAGIEFQDKYERLAFALGGNNYHAPAQSVGEFLGKRINSNINPSYRPNITLTKIEKCLPSFVTTALKEALPILNKKLNGFAKDENLLIAIESRSSCPLTINRDENYESSIHGLYPVGEGAGYAGGIISSAQDGIKCAEKIYENIKTKQF